jgi:hypothetical protein
MHTACGECTGPVYFHDITLGTLMACDPMGGLGGSIQFSKIQVFNTLTCSNYAFLGFIQQILGFLYILITLLSNYISFSNR